ncbi:unnamed protein product [Thlaspi arvense]|uniref:Replication factor A C-terminal domain-containing protein n=1 Tax=Thlaspi arvense TaxID=13288 RepID=A0AAU9RPA7_THLAR|nr:unnamed protein product [Thlaspi arvense]
MTSAKVEAIDNPKQWYYLACKTCGLKVQQYGEDSDDVDRKPIFNCKTCGDIEDVFSKYYLILRVSDDFFSETRFLLFDKLAAKLIQISATDIFEKYSEEDP